jgi:hypothetical protein
MSETPGQQAARAALAASIEAQRLSGELPLLPPSPTPSGAAVPRKEIAVAEPRPKFKFDPTINLGHVLTFVGLIITGFGAYSLLEKRVTVLEVQQARAGEDNLSMRHELKEATRDLRQDMKDVQKAVNELASSLRSSGREDRR